jgi:hypothetical protein
MNLIPIFHPGRCASTFLEKVLANAGFMHFGEICQPSNPWIRILPDSDWQKFSSVEDLLLYVACQASLLASYDTELANTIHKEHAFLEFKLNGYNIRPFSDLENIARSPVVSSCIFLYSKNYLRRLASIYRAVNHNQWHIEKGDTSYKPTLIDINWGLVSDGDIFRIVDKTFTDSVELYRTLMITQSEILRQVCASLCKPFIAISFEELTSADSRENTILKCLKDLRTIESSDIAAINLRGAIEKVSLQKSGFHNPLDGLEEECLHRFKQIESFEKYLPGGSQDLYIPSWY